MIEYSDKSWHGRREYQLDLTRIRVRARQTSSGADFDTTIELRSLIPEYDRLWLRNPLLIPNLLAIFAGFPCLMNFSRVAYPHLFDITAGVFLVAIISIVFTIRKIHAVQFKTIAGAPALLILQAGPRKSEFSQFVSAIQEAIVRAEQIADGKTPESTQPPN